MYKDYLSALSGCVGLIKSPPWSTNAVLISFLGPFMTCSVKGADLASLSMFSICCVAVDMNVASAHTPGTTCAIRD